MLHQSGWRSQQYEHDCKLSPLPPPPPQKKRPTLQATYYESSLDDQMTGSISETRIPHRQENKKIWCTADEVNPP